MKNNTMFDTITKDAGDTVNRVMKQAHAYAPKNKGRGQGGTLIGYDDEGNPVYGGVDSFTQNFGEPQPKVQQTSGRSLSDPDLAQKLADAERDRQLQRELAGMKIGSQSDIYGQQIGAQRDIADMQRDVSLAGMASQERMLGSQLASTEALTREWYILTAEMQKTGLDAQKAMHAAQLAETAERRLMEERLGMRKIDLEEKMALMNILSESKKMGIQAWMAALQTQEAGLSRRAKQSTDIANINANYNLGLLDRAQGAAYGEALRGNESPVIRSQIPQRFLTSPAAGMQLEPVANVQMPSTQISPEEIEAMLAARKKGGGQGAGLDQTGRLMRGEDDDWMSGITPAVGDDNIYKMPFQADTGPSIPSYGPQQTDFNAEYGKWIGSRPNPPTAQEKTDWWKKTVLPNYPNTPMSVAPVAGQTWNVPKPDVPDYVSSYEPGVGSENVWMAYMAKLAARFPHWDEATLIQTAMNEGVPGDFAKAYAAKARGFSSAADAIFKKGLPYTQAYNEAMAAGIPQEFLVNNPGTQIPRTPAPSTEPPINKGVYAGFPIATLSIDHPARWAVNPMLPTTQENAQFYARFGKDMPNYRKPGGGGQGAGYSFLDEPMSEQERETQWELNMSPEERRAGEEWIGNMKAAGNYASWNDYWKMKSGSQEPGEEGFDWAIPGALRAIAGRRSLPPGPIPSGVVLPTAEQSANMAPSEWGLVRKGLKAQGIPFEDYANAIKWHTPPWESKPQATSYSGF